MLNSTLTALIWYVLAIGCLFALRRMEPRLFHRYQAPLTRVLPAIVIATLSEVVIVRLPGGGVGRGEDEQELKRWNGFPGLEAESGGFGRGDH